MASQGAQAQCAPASRARSPPPAPAPAFARAPSGRGSDAPAARCPGCASDRRAAARAPAPARSPAAPAPPPPSRGPLEARLSPSRVCLSRLAGEAPCAGPGASAGRPLASVARHRLRRLCSRASWHDTLALAHRGVPQGTQRGAPGGGPLGLSDGRKEDGTALLPPWGAWLPPARRQAQGPRPPPQWRPRPALREAPGGQAARRRRLVGVPHRVVCGPRLALAPLLARWGGTIPSACAARLPLASRPRVAAIGRRGKTLCQGAAGLREQWALWQGSPTCVCPPASLPRPCPSPDATTGRGSAPVWQPCPPAMAAGVTDHVGSLKAVLFYRVPPWPQTSTVKNRMPVEERGVERRAYAQMQANRGGREVASRVRGLMPG